MSSGQSNKECEENTNLKRKSANEENTSSNQMGVSSNIITDLLKKKKAKLGIKKEAEPVLVCNANEVIYFKVIHNKEEFEAFQKMENMEHCFNPYFTNQVLNDTETITGYKNLKILISLTPKLLFPHIKFVYDCCSQVKDDLELVFRSQYEQVYETDDQKFLEKLSKESEESLAPMGKLVFSENNKQVYYIDILKDEAFTENWNFQCLCTFFIDGASFIPFRDNFWSYFTLYEKEDSHYNLLGFTSCLNVNLSSTAHRSMISQFLILPPFQRRGLGYFLLDKVYDYYVNSDPACIEITTEDPAEEFILLRDITIFKKITYLGYFDKFIESQPTAEQFGNIKLSLNEVKEISGKLKVTKNLIRRCLCILKFTLINNNTQLHLIFKKECQDLIFKWNRGDFEIDYILKNRRGPFISFHDEPEFDTQEALNEIKYLNNTEMTKHEKLEMLFAELENEFKKISAKCSKIINEYKIAILVK